MSYQKQNFANGEVLTAAQLNHIENGIADVESAANATKGVVDKIIDPTLSVSGKAADAAKVGEAVNAESERAKGVESQIKEDIATERKRIDVLNEGGLNLKDEVIDTSIKQWLDDHPEATTTVQDGAVTYKKLSVDICNDLSDANRIPLSKSLVATLRATICGDSQHYIQGGCYVDTTGHFVFAFAPVAGAKTTILVELDTDFSTIIKTSESVNYGHCNDLTYNKNTDKIYASSTGHKPESIYKDKIIIINPHDLSIESAIDKIENNVSAISYDVKNDLYYTVEILKLQNNHRIVCKYNSNFDFVESLGDAYIIDPNKQVGQCSFVYDGIFYLTSESNIGGHHVWFNTFGENPRVWQHDNFAYYETEAVVECKNKLYLVSIKNNDYIYVYELGTKKIIHNYTNEMYLRGTVLKKEADLNDILQTGKYYETASSASTIKNTPYRMSDEFTVDVLHTGYNNLEQILITSLHEVFVRTYKDGWGKWISLRSGFKFRGQSVNTGNWYSVGFFTAGSTELRVSIPMEIESSVNAANITSGFVRVLQNGNTIIEQTEISEFFDGMDIMKSDVGISISLKASQKIENAINNDTAVVQFYSLVIAFS